MNQKLTLRQRRFARNMADPQTQSGTEAAIRAGYSKKTATVISSENLTKPNVQGAIKKYRDEQSDNARDFAWRLKRLLSRLLRRLEDFDEGELNLESVGALTKLVSELRLAEVKLREILPGEDSGVTPELWAQVHLHNDRIATQVATLAAKHGPEGAIAAWRRIATIGRRVYGQSETAALGAYIVDLDPYLDQERPRGSWGSTRASDA